MCIISKTNLFYHNILRKIKTPKPRIINELLEKFSEPKEFEEMNKASNDSKKHFNNWSFVNSKKI
jgi:hypothetical protein